MFHSVSVVTAGSSHNSLNTVSEKCVSSEMFPLGKQCRRMNHSQCFWWSWKHDDCWRDGTLRRSIKWQHGSVLWCGLNVLWAAGHQHSSSGCWISVTCVSECVQVCVRLGTLSERMWFVSMRSTFGPVCHQRAVCFYRLFPVCRATGLYYTTETHN